MNIIKGAERIIHDYGFHDDIIKEIHITPGRIEIKVEMVTFPEGRNSYPDVIFVFEGISSFDFEEEDTIFDFLTCILHLDFTMVDNLIQMDIAGDGVVGRVICKNIKIKIS
ncbi:MULTISPECIES: hypothetical protein [Carboxydocella]|nr:MULTISPECIES: hypothetical protein [Carboxydocella]